MGESGSGDICAIFLSECIKVCEVCACVCVMQMAHLGQGRLGGWQGEREIQEVRGACVGGVEQHCLKQQA
jgi:hypothetical protein